MLELEEFLSVVVANVFNHLVNALLLVALEWYETSLDVVADEVTEGATEVLVTWVREERT